MSFILEFASIFAAAALGACFGTWIAVACMDRR